MAAQREAQQQARGHNLQVAQDLVGGGVDVLEEEKLRRGGTEAVSSAEQREWGRKAARGAGPSLTTCHGAMTGMIKLVLPAGNSLMALLGEQSWLRAAPGLATRQPPLHAQPALPLWWGPGWGLAGRRATLPGRCCGTCR